VTTIIRILETNLLIEINVVRKPTTIIDKNKRTQKIIDEVKNININKLNTFL
jgi:hypothetical protein